MTAPLNELTSAMGQLDPKEGGAHSKQGSQQRDSPQARLTTGSAHHS